MSQLIFFILGILFIEFFQPLVESIATLFVTFIKVAERKALVVISKFNKQIEEFSEEKEQPHNAIGFVVSHSDEEECEEYNE